MITVPHGQASVSEELKQSMDRVVTHNVWRHVQRASGRRATKLAAIAYVSKRTPLSFRRGDVLVCDASDHAIRSGETDAKTLKGFFEAGASLYSCANLHAKTMVSHRLAVLGSANLSRSSELNLIEASLITTRTQIVSQATAFIHSLLEISIPIDEQFISRICSLPVVTRRRVFARKKKQTFDLGHRYWIASVRLLERFPEYEGEYIEQGEQEAHKALGTEKGDISWIRWVGKTKLREVARQGDTLIEIFRRNAKTEVFEPRPILFRQEHPKWTRFYLEERKSLKSMSWSKFEKQLKNVGLAGITENSVRELTAKQIALMESIWQSK